MKFLLPQGSLYLEDTAPELAINLAIKQASAHIPCLRAYLLLESHSPSYNLLYYMSFVQFCREK